MPLELPSGPCLFCERIAGKRDDWAVIVEAGDTIAFMNPLQFEVGQALVIPRRHASTILDLTEQEATSMMRTVHRLSRAMVDAFDPDGLTLYQNNGVASYQGIPHVHVHVVPRRYGSGWGEGPPHIAALERGQRERRFDEISVPKQQQELAKKLRQHLASIGAPP
ncbi:MAG: HIT family protein [Dehalococcoidia bacterium]